MKPEALNFELQFHQHMALEHPVVKDKIHEVVRISDQNPLLAGFKTESVAQLQ